MVKVLGIAGSPRRGGNTEMLLDAALDGAASGGGSVEKIVLNDLDFDPCQGCGGCDATGKCVVADDMQLVYEKMDSADAIIVASPIFFGSLTAQLKMMIDRLQCFWVLKYVLKRPDERARKGIFLCAGGSREKKFFEDAKKVIKIFFATINIKYAGGLFYGKIEKAGDIKKRKGALKKAFDAGERLVESFDKN